MASIIPQRGVIALSVDDLRGNLLWISAVALINRYWEIQTNAYQEIKQDGKLEKKHNYLHVFVTKTQSEVHFVRTILNIQYLCLMLNLVNINVSTIQ